MSSENKQPSEEIYGISKQPAETCPMIDSGLDVVRTIARSIRGYERADESELRDMLANVEYHIGALDGYARTGIFEEIRRNVMAIRAWGNEWKEYAKRNAPTPEEAKP